jgi:putative hydrolase of the HAD superfamily
MDGYSVSRESWRRALRSCGCTDEAVVRFAFEQHRSLGRAQMRLFVDAEELLVYLSTTDIRVGVVTNGPADFQREKLDALGLSGCIDGVVVSGECGLAKPDAAVFGVALDQLGVAPADAWHIGDSLTTDVAGALSAGVFAVWVNRTGLPGGDGETPPHVEIGTLSDAVAMLRSFDRAAPD